MAWLQSDASSTVACSASSLMTPRRASRISTWSSTRRTFIQLLPAHYADENIQHSAESHHVGRKCLVGDCRSTTGGLLEVRLGSFSTDPSGLTSRLMSVLPQKRP